MIQTSNIENAEALHLCGKIEKKESVAIALFLLALFLFRIYNLQIYDVISADGTSYGPIGRAFFQTGSFRAFGTISGPVYSFLVGLLDLVLHDLERSLRLVSVVLSTATVGIVYFFARSLFGIKGGVSAALICTSLPFLHGMSGFDIIEPTFGFFLVSSAFVIWIAYLHKSVGFSLVAGLLVGVSYLSRSEGFITWFAISTLLISMAIKTARSDGLKLLSRVVIPFCLGFLVLFMPYLVYLHAETGIWQLSGKNGLNAQVIREYLGKSGPDQKLRLDDKGGFDNGKNESLSRLIKEEPGLMKQNFINNLKQFPIAVAGAMTWYLLAAVIAAIAFAPWSGQYLIARAILIGVCSPMVIYLLFFVQPRGLYPYIAFLCIWAGGGISLLDKVVPTLLRRFHVSLLLIAIIFICFVYADFPRQKPPYQYEQDGARRDDKHIGQRLKTILPVDAIIMTRSGRIGFYSGRQYLLPPQASYAEIMNYAFINKVTHLIVTPQIIGMRPQLRPLFAPLETPFAPFVAPPEVRLIYTGMETGGLPYLVYQLLPPA
jgi:4-amino-4-deoxy-L-arabinose transferase-like glycosyltransferase